MLLIVIFVKYIRGTPRLLGGLRGDSMGIVLHNLLHLAVQVLLVGRMLLLVGLRWLLGNLGSFQPSLRLLRLCSIIGGLSLVHLPIGVVDGHLFCSQTTLLIGLLQPVLLIRLEELEVGVVSWASTLGRCWT